MLDTMCHMMCENKAGEIVATNVAPELMNGEVCMEDEYNRVKIRHKNCPVLYLSWSSKVIL